MVKPSGVGGANGHVCVVKPRGVFITGSRDQWACFCKWVWWRNIHVYNMYELVTSIACMLCSGVVVKKSKGGAQN